MILKVRDLVLHPYKITHENYSSILIFKFFQALPMFRIKKLEITFTRCPTVKLR
jgi:hypothetical protein